MGQPIITQLWTYPVKSLRGTRTPKARVGPRGLLHDRQWMIVDSGGRFLSQRTLPRMTLVRASAEAGCLTLRATGQPDLVIRELAESRDTIRVEVWGYTGPAWPAGTRADDWLSRFLKTPCRLVQMPPSAHRQARESGHDGELAFADAYPFLILSEESLEALGERLPDPVSIERFRPNVVVRGGGPHAEDRWSCLRGGPISLHLVKPCPRCAIPGVDPETGETRPEPLATLASYRRRGAEILFGMNAIHHGTGPLEEGMEVTVE